MGLLSRGIEQRSISADAIVTRSKHRTTALARRSLCHQICSCIAINDMMSEKYTSSQTGWSFQPDAYMVCHRCGYNDPMPDLYLSRCQVCDTVSIPYGNVIVHDTDIAITILHAIGDPEKCTVLSPHGFVDICSRVLSENDFATTGVIDISSQITESTDETE